MLSLTSIVHAFERLNHNVQVALVYTGLSSFAVGIWGTAVLSGYLKVLTGTNTKVGIAEGIQGVCQVLIAFPAGYLCDTSRRDQVLQYSAIIGVTSIIILLFDLLYYSNSTATSSDPDTSINTEFTLMCLGLGLFGVFTGCTITPLEALYADSTNDINRSKLNQYKFTVTMIASCSGPLTAILLFFFIGDVWSLHELRTVFALGVILLIPANIIIWFFDDDKSLTSKTIINSIDNIVSENIDDIHEPLIAETYDNGHVTIDVPPSELVLRQRYWIPRIIVGTDLMAGFASGMTIKFFPLFFKEEAMMTPIEVSLTLILSYFTITFFGYLFREVIVPRIGRVRAMVCFGTAGSLLLTVMFLMSIGYDVKMPGQVPLWRVKWIMIPLYVVRTALMNAFGPVKRAFLMEFVPKNERGFWSAFQSLTQFGWSGSAVVGGMIMDAKGYGVTFFATSMIQLSYSLATGFLLYFTD